MRQNPLSLLLVRFSEHSVFVQGSLSQHDVSICTCFRIIVSFFKRPDLDEVALSGMPSTNHCLDLLVLADFVLERVGELLMKALEVAIHLFKDQGFARFLVVFVLLEVHDECVEVLRLLVLVQANVVADVIDDCSVLIQRKSESVVKVRTGVRVQTLLSIDRVRLELEVADQELVELGVPFHQLQHRGHVLFQLLFPLV